MVVYLKSKEPTPDYVSIRSHYRFISDKIDTSKELFSFNTQTVQQIVTLKQSTGVQGATIKKLFNFIRGFQKLGKANGYRVAITEFPTIKVNKPRIRYLTVDEEKRLLKELEPTSQCHWQEQLDNYHFTITLLDTGARHGEITRLTWDEITESSFGHRILVGEESVIRAQF